jgi:hypothetical protein
VSATSLFVAASASSGSAWVAPTIVISIVALGVSLATFFLAGRRVRLDRQRQVFADAFEAVAEYREYPYIVRRRSPDEPAKERQRIAGELSRVQAKLNAFKARLLVEDRYVGEHYAALVKQTRQIVGAMIKAGWDNEPVSADGEMHAPKYDFSELEPLDERYLQTIADHLGWLYAPLRRKLRRNPARLSAAGPLETKASQGDARSGATPT